MALKAGTRVGSYDIVAKLGEGGMGEVYRAHDTQLGRDVAIKVLPPAVAHDADRLARFAREAKVLASLNHPAIAHVYGFEHSGDTHAIVMELVAGEDLSQRIGRGALPLDDALAIAAQIADALTAAHEQGIIHRDLKPANIKIRDDGTVKVLDFGLAKALAPDGRSGAADVANSPTLTAPTAMGTILGTAAYMAPEQARGKAVDRRADLWAFGCVLIEMLSGRRAFTGDDVTEILASVVKTDPDWSALPKDTPPAILRLLHRCLVKDPRQRLADASTARLEVEEARRAPETIAAPARAVRGRSARLAWLVAIAMTAVAIAVVWWTSTRERAPAVIAAPEVRFDVATPESAAAPILSPDGRQVAYPGGDIVVRSLTSEASTTLRGTAGTFNPFWAPDGKSIAFFSSQKLKRIDIATGAIGTLADAPTPRGGTWSPDGRTIVFAPGGNGPLMRLDVAGGAPVPVTSLRGEEVSHREPVFLPDGRHFLFWVLGPRGVRGVYAGSLDSPDTRRLLDADTAATFLPPAHVLFIREGVLYAQQLDVARLALQGDPMPVVSGLTATSTRPIGVSAAPGVIAFRRPAPLTQQLTWFDRSGTKLGTVGEPMTDWSYGGRLSPDGATVVFAREPFGEASVWLMDVARGTVSRVSTDGGRPAWSPKGDRIAYQSSRDGLVRIYLRGLGANDAAETLWKSPEAQNLSDWSPDGKLILLASQSATTARDLWIVPVTGDRTPIAFARTPAEESQGRFSPDSTLIAYFSNELGVYQLFVRPVSGSRPAVQVSRKAVSGQALSPAPVWRQDGHELYYAGAGGWMAATVDVRADGAIVVGPETAMPSFPGEMLSATDGKRFLVRAILAIPPTPPVTIIVNWRGDRK